MSRISTHCELRYTVHTPTDFMFVVEPQPGAHQQIVQGTLMTTPELPLVDVQFEPASHRAVRVRAEPGLLWLVQDSIVSVNAEIPDEAPVTETPFGQLPPAVLDYLVPSRYCPSDLLARFAVREFGDLLPGFSRVTAVCNWVYEHLEYVPGSTGPSTTAVDVLVEGAGVCRDYAHLAITVCRALGIPARYLSGYAVDLDPPDFHGFFEAYLDGEWYLFDATRMVPIGGLVRIAAGRDAADVAFATIVGAATLDSMFVSVIDLDRTAPDDGTTAAAMSTA